MKIISLQAENIKKLVAVNIVPGSNMVQITGKNGQGKSSVLDSIWWAITGATHIQSAPIRVGATEARIRLDLGELIVTRTFKSKGEGEATTSLKVENADGASYSSPQTMLDKLFGKLSFDPLVFVRNSPAYQFETLRQFVSDVDFEGIDAANKKDFQARTEINRKLAEAKATADSIKITDAPPVEFIDDMLLAEELEASAKKNSETEKRKANRESAQKRKDEFISLISHLEKQLDVAKADLKAVEDLLSNAEPLPDLINLSDITQQLKSARENNEKLLDWQRDKGKLQSLRDTEKSLSEQSSSLTLTMEERTAKKKAAIAAAKMPIEGIGFGDGFVTFNGVPLDQASDAEKLRISVAIAIASNPTLRVIRIQDGSLLDDDSLAIIAKMADENDIQVWIEKVDSSGKIGFVIEDGHLKDSADIKE